MFIVQQLLVVVFCVLLMVCFYRFGKLIFKNTNESLIDFLLLVAVMVSFQMIVLFFFEPYSYKLYNHAVKSEIVEDVEVYGAYMQATTVAKDDVLIAVMGNYEYTNFADKPLNGVNTYKKIKYSNSNKLIAMFLFPKTETSLVFYEDNPKTFYKNLNNA